MEEIPGAARVMTCICGLPLGCVRIGAHKEPIRNLGLCSTRGTREPVANIASRRDLVQCAEVAPAALGCTSIPGLGGGGRNSRGRRDTCGLMGTRAGMRAKNEGLPQFPNGYLRQSAPFQF
jgi:hypothetical protein